ncbi:MAG: hypothetical protein ACRD0U_19095 [Acidimicrobiales bacterium]
MRRRVIIVAVVLGLAACTDSSRVPAACETPANLMAPLSGVNVSDGVPSTPSDGTAECTYAGDNGRSVHIYVTTVDAGGRYSTESAGGRDISSVGDEARLFDRKLYVHQGREYWIIDIVDPDRDEQSLEVALIAVANELGL